MVGSPEEIRTPVSGSRAAQIGQNCAPLVIRDVEWAVSDFWEYCNIEERLSNKVSRDYKNVAKRLLTSCNGALSREAIRDFLRPYLEKAPKTYNNIIEVDSAWMIFEPHKGHTCKIQEDGERIALHFLIYNF
jgi:hypothetical protein